MHLPVTASRKGRNFRREFAKDERGNITILLAFMLIPIMVVAALALDGLRALNAATTTSNALDSAALAAARAMADGSLSDSEVKDVATRYFEANAHGDAKVSYSTHGSLNVTADRETGEVTVSVDTTVPTTLARVINFNEFKFRREASALAGVGEIELGLMLDVTGSMDERGKLDALKRATMDLIDIIVPKGQYADRVRIGFAPYSASVNVGDFAGIVSNNESSDGCVVNREGSAIDKENGPGPGAYFRSIEQADAAITNDNLKGKRARIGYDFYKCPDAKVLPLTSDKELLRKTIGGYSADGRTAGHLGAAWAWYLVSPEWTRVWGSNGAKPYGSKDLIKAIVLMTDGEFNAAYAGSDVRPDTDNESFRRTKALCDAAKQKGVMIFAVAFDLDDIRAEKALENCATDEDFFLQAENEQELRDAYRRIAIKLTQLRLSK
ncbi:MAG: pilus assembly protein TadG-related protein [Hyphomicrobiaceae bacterium]|nr:pilus assembly protein TadG-related protein [Hyphomicrobiaceae bacterium]